MVPEGWIDTPFQCLPEATLGVVRAPSPGVLQPMQPPLPTLPGPSNTWAYSSGPGFPSQAGEMSDPDVSRVTPSRSEQCKQTLAPHAGDGTPWVQDVGGPSEQPTPSGS